MFSASAEWCVVCNLHDQPCVANTLHAMRDAPGRYRQVVHRPPNGAVSCGPAAGDSFKEPAVRFDFVRRSQSRRPSLSPPPPFPREPSPAASAGSPLLRPKTAAVLAFCTVVHVSAHSFRSARPSLALAAPAGGLHCSEQNEAQSRALGRPSAATGGEALWRGDRGRRAFLSAAAGPVWGLLGQLGGDGRARCASGLAAAARGGRRSRRSGPRAPCSPRVRV